MKGTSWTVTLNRHYEGSIKALLRLYEGSVKARYRHPIEALLCRRQVDELESNAKKNKTVSKALAKFKA